MLSQEASAVVASFGQQPGVTREHLDNFNRVLNDSPELTRQINEAVQKKLLKGFAPLNDPHAGGTYDPRDQEIHLPLAALVNDANGKHAAAGDLTFVLGHEIQHSLYSPTAALAREQFKTEAIKIARSTHDYTAAGEKVLASNRADEATAEIAGWNAIVSAVKSRNPNPTLEDVYLFADGRARDFVTRSGYPSIYTPKANLAFNSDLTLSPTAGNVEAMGVNYFDKSVKDTRIGHAGQSDYVNHYGPWVVGTAAIYERHYNKSKPGEPEQPMILDMQRLGFNEEILEHNGIDLGSDTRPMPYLDSSTQPPTPGLFQHSKDTHLHVSPISAQALEQEPARARPTIATSPSAGALTARPPRPRAISADQKWCDAARRPARQRVGRGKSAHDCQPACAGKEEGLSRVDHVVLNNPTGQLAGGEKVFVVQGALNDPAHQRAHMPTVDAVQSPESQSFDRVQAINQTQAQAREQQQALEQSQQAVTQAGPSMTR